MPSFLSRACAVLALLLALLQPMCLCASGCASMMAAAKPRPSAASASASACERRCAARNAERSDASPCKRGGSCECTLRAPVKMTAPIAPEPPSRTQLDLAIPCLHQLVGQSVTVQGYSVGGGPCLGGLRLGDSLDVQIQ